MIEIIEVKGSRVVARAVRENGSQEKVDER